jgi:hypothetical protein
LHATKAPEPLRPDPKNSGKSASEGVQDRIGRLEQGVIWLRLASLDDLLPVSGE